MVSQPIIEGQKVRNVRLLQTDESIISIIISYSLTTLADHTKIKSCLPSRVGSQNHDAASLKTICGLTSCLTAASSITLM